MTALAAILARRLTSVSVTKGILHPAGGTILHIPYFLALSEIDLMYPRGSFHCSSVG